MVWSSVGSTLAFIASITAVRWLLADFLGLGHGAANLLVVPAAILVALYVPYVVGLRWYATGQGGSLSRHEVVRLAVVLAIWDAALLYGAILAAVAFPDGPGWQVILGLGFATFVSAVPFLRRGERVGPRAFVQAYRIFVFGAIGILPVAAALGSLLTLHRIPEAVLFAVLAAIITPWAGWKLWQQIR
ncbi:MAG: hypothetical protein ACRELZ_05680 [Candidatus Rokuibacteriota bacterium]